MVLTVPQVIEVELVVIAAHPSSNFFGVVSVVERVIFGVQALAPVIATVTAKSVGNPTIEDTQSEE